MPLHADRRGRGPRARAGARLHPDAPLLGSRGGRAGDGPRAGAASTRPGTARRATGAAGLGAGAGCIAERRRPGDLPRLLDGRPLLPPRWPWPDPSVVRGTGARSAAPPASRTPASGPLGRAGPAHGGAAAGRWARGVPRRVAAASRCSRRSRRRGPFRAERLENTVDGLAVEPASRPGPARRTRAWDRPGRAGDARAGAGRGRGRQVRRPRRADGRRRSAPTPPSPSSTGAGHAAHLEQPERFLAIVQPWLAATACDRTLAGRDGLLGPATRTRAVRQRDCRQAPSQRPAASRAPVTSCTRPVAPSTGMRAGPAAPSSTWTTGWRASTMPDERGGRRRRGRSRRRRRGCRGTRRRASPT